MVDKLLMGQPIVPFATASSADDPASDVPPGMRIGRASWSWRSEMDGAWYIALDERASPPYRRQVHIDAIIDLDADERVAGIEIIDEKMREPPLGAPRSGGEAAEGVRTEDTSNTTAEIADRLAAQANQRGLAGVAEFDGATEIRRLTAENARLAKELASAERFRDAAVEASDFFAAKLVTAEAALSEARAEVEQLRIDADNDGSRIKSLKAGREEARAEGWRQGIEAAARLMEARAGRCKAQALHGDRRLLECLELEARMNANGIRSLPLPVSGGVQGEKLDE